MSNYHTKIQEVIQWQNIRQLVHFTRITNLRSIIEYGILSRQEIEKRKINQLLILIKQSNNSLISFFEDCLPKLILNDPSICSSDIFKADKT